MGEEIPLAVSQEDDMSTLEDINNQIDAGRRTIERSVGDARNLEMPDVPPGVVMAGVVAAVVAVGVVGWMLYRSRRRRTLMERLQDALPDSVRELPQGLQARVKRAK
jgi:hypothetical protein